MINTRNSTDRSTKEYQEQYRADHTQESIEYNKQYRKYNRETLYARHKAYRENNKGHLRQYIKSYQSTHKEKIKAKAKIRGSVKFNCTNCNMGSTEVVAECTRKAMHCAIRIVFIWYEYCLSNTYWIDIFPFR